MVTTLVFTIQYVSTHLYTEFNKFFVPKYQNLERTVKYFHVWTQTGCLGLDRGGVAVHNEPSLCAPGRSSLGHALQTQPIS